MSKIPNILTRESEQREKQTPELQHPRVIVVVAEVGEDSVRGSPKIFVSHLVVFDSGLESSELSPRSLDTVSVSTPDDSSTIGNVELDFAISERLCERSYLRLPTVYVQAHSLRSPDDFFSDDASYLDTSGNIYGRSCNDSSIGVRPALEIKKIK